MLQEGDRDRLGREQKRWQEEILSEAFSRLGRRKEHPVTTSGTPLKPLYTPLDLEEQGFDYLRDAGFPGEFPYLRGSTPSGYLSTLPIVSQYAGFGLPEDCNQRWKFLIESGATNMHVAMDLPCQCGYDADHPMAAGEVGKVGVSLNSLRDVELMFDGIDLSQLREVVFMGNANTPVWIGMFLALCERQKVDPGVISLGVQNDVLKEYCARGAYIFPVKSGVKITVDAIEYAGKLYPEWEPVHLSGSHFRGAGATGVQEAAFTMADGFCYIEETMKRGLKPDDFVRLWWIQLAASPNLLEEVARYRAVRRLWAKLLRERYGASSPEALAIRLRSQTLAASFTRHQPLDNIVRGTLELLAGILAGGEYLACHPYGEAWGLPSKEVQAMQIRTQLVALHETDLASVIDPLAGSYCIEALTNEMEQEILREIERIDHLGGAAAAIEKGYYEREIARSAWAEQMAVDSREKVVVGVNAYKTDEAMPVKPTVVDETIQQKQAERLNSLRRERDNGHVERALDAVRRAADREENLIPSVLEAVQAYATQGEICDALREVYGEYVAGMNASA